jgi:HSP20 family protein
MAENVPKAVTPAALAPFGGDFDQLFNRMLRGWPFGWLEPMANGQPRTLRPFEHAPKVEVKEHVKSYTIAVELPGLDQKDVKVLVEDDTVTISGEKHVERSDRSAATAASRGPSPCRRMPTATASRPILPRVC